MKLFGNSNASMHNASRSAGAKSGKTAGNGYSKAEAEAYARKMDSRNRANERRESGKAGGRSGRKKSRAKIAVIIIFAVLAVLAAAFAIWWKAKVKPPAITTKKNNPIANLIKDGTTVNDDGDPITVDTPDDADSDRKEGVYTFLLLGMDDGNGNTDTIMAVTFDTVNYTLDLVSIPRDTLVNVPWSVKKANTLYYNYKQEGVKEAFADLLGYEVDFYVVVDIEAFVVLINDIGGVDYDVPRNMNYEDEYQNLYIHLNEGMQHLTGEQAIGVMRYRKGYADADIGRIRTQQDFLKTVARQLMEKKDKLSISTLASVFIKYVKTDLDYGNIIWLAKEFFKMDMENMNFYTMPANYDDSVNGTSYPTIYLNDWLEMINEHLNPFKESIIETDLDILTRNSSGTLYATSGVKAGGSSWGSSSSSGSSSGSSENDSGSSGEGTEPPPEVEPDPNENEPPDDTGEEPVPPDDTEPIEQDPENPPEETPTEPGEGETPTEQPVEPPTEPEPTEPDGGTDGGTDGEYHGV